MEIWTINDGVDYPPLYIEIPVCQAIHWLSYPVLNPLISLTVKRIKRNKLN